MDSLAVYNDCMTESEAREFASTWVAAWNSHELDLIMSHYDVDVVLISPFVVRILDNPSGTVEGATALRNYFSIVLYYKNQKGTRTAEFMEFDKNGKIVRVIANYNG